MTKLNLGNVICEYHQEKNRKEMVKIEWPNKLAQERVNEDENTRNSNDFCLAIFVCVYGP